MLALAVCNYLLQQNVEIRHKLAAYAGRSVRLVLPLAQIDSAVGDDGFLIAATGQPETALCFQDSAVRKVLQGSTPGVGDVTITGDHALGMALLPLLGGLRYDLSDDVARLFGDAAAGWVARGVAACQAGSTDLRHSVSVQVADYARENDAWVVGKAQFDVFAENVAAVRDDVARLAQRIRHLQGRNG